MMPRFSTFLLLIVVSVDAFSCPRLTTLRLGPSTSISNGEEGKRVRLTFITESLRDGDVETESSTNGEEATEFELSSKDSFLSENIEKFANDLENLGKSDDEAEIESLISTASDQFEKELSELRETYVKRLSDLEEKLAKEQYARSEERNESSAKIAALRDSAVRDTNQALLTEKVKADGVKKVLERRLDDQRREIVGLKQNMMEANDLVQKLQGQVSEYEQERSNVLRMFRQSCRVVGRSTSNRLRNIFGRRRPRSSHSPAGTAAAIVPSMERKKAFENDVDLDVDNAEIATEAIMIDNDSQDIPVESDVVNKAPSFMRDTTEEETAKDETAKDETTGEVSGTVFLESSEETTDVDNDEEDEPDHDN